MPRGLLSRKTSGRWGWASSEQPSCWGTHALTIDDFAQGGHRPSRHLSASILPFSNVTETRSPCPFVQECLLRACGPWHWHLHRDRLCWHVLPFNRALTVLIQALRDQLFDRPSMDGFPVGETGQAACWVFYSFLIITATLPMISHGGPAYAGAVSPGGDRICKQRQSQKHNPVATLRTRL